MSLKYASLESINSALHGRMRVGGVTHALGQSAIAPEMVLQEAEQVESLMDGIIQSRYKVPLKNEHKWLEGLAIDGVECGLYQQYFLSQSSSEGSERDIGVCSQFYKKLKLLKEIPLAGEELITPDATNQPISWMYACAGDRVAPSATVEW